ncbi:MAG TPA: hypothetical protein VG844_16045 [Terracidiphilus sp.]|nr:hypothetical protein [Terracidiphilus sp.]
MPVLLLRNTTMHIFTFFLAMCASIASAQQLVSIPGLGAAFFPTSTQSPVAQQDFMRGLLLLHLFEYHDAAKAFIAAEQADPSFAMAYWGEAMTYNHPVWNQVDIAAGSAALNKFAPTLEARAARIKDPRERAYMAAVEILYTDKGSKKERDAQYLTAMQALARSYPKDDEAQLFYALALLGRSEGVRDVPTYLKAAAIAKAVFKHNPHHPGAAHYWIHGMDDPQHAAGALVAARALSKIAPDAAHAQHMCSHIFLALGMWSDVVNANVAATSVVNRHAAAVGRLQVHCGHYNYWLLYGYIEQGRIAEAGKILAACHDDAAAAHLTAASRAAIDPDQTKTGSFVAMQDTFLLNAELPLNSAPASLTIDLNGAVMSEFRHAYSRGLAEANAGNATAAQQQLAHLEQLLPQLPAIFERNAVPPDDPSRTVPEIEYLQLKAAVLAAQSRLDDAIVLLHQAVEKGKKLPYAFGPPDPEKPTEEFLGDLLMSSGKPGEALSPYMAQLRHTPNRTYSLLGLARAESEVGDMRAATETARKLLGIWKQADKGYAPVAVARKLAAEVTK